MAEPDVLIRGRHAIAAGLMGIALRLGLRPSWIADERGMRPSADLSLVLAADWAAAPHRNRLLVLAWAGIMQNLLGGARVAIVPVRAMREATMVAETIGGILDLRALEAAGLEIVVKAPSDVTLHPIAEAPDPSAVIVHVTPGTPPWTWAYDTPWNGRVWSSRGGDPRETIIGVVPALPPALRIRSGRLGRMSVHVSGNSLILLPELLPLMGSMTGAPWRPLPSEETT